MNEGPGRTPVMDRLAELLASLPPVSQGVFLVGFAALTLGVFVMILEAAIWVGEWVMIR